MPEDITRARMLHMAVARPFSDSVAIYCVLPALSMTSYLHINGPCGGILTLRLRAQANVPAASYSLRRVLINVGA